MDSARDLDTGLWRRNLPVVWAALMFSMSSFSFIYPFMPLYIRTLGMEEPERAALWTGLIGGAAGLGMFIGGPVWGMVGDRYGRKNNMARALLCTAAAVALNGAATNVHQLLAFRFLGGLTSGIPPTAMALIASQAPRTRTAFCMGVLMMAMFVGNTIGPLAGGFLAEAMGFRNAFFAAGGVIGLVSIVVLFRVKEEFRRPPELAAATPLSQFRSFVEVLKIREVLGVLGVFFMIQMSPSIMFPVFPLFLQELTGGAGGTTWSGFAFSLMGLTSAVASLFIGQLARRLGLKGLVIGCALLSGLFYLPMLVVNAPYQAVVLAGIWGLFSGAMGSSGSALLGLAVPPGQHGRVFGASQSVVATAFGLGPLAGGALATLLGLRLVFLVNALAFFLAGLIGARTIAIREERVAPAPGARGANPTDEEG